MSLIALAITVALALVAAIGTASASAKTVLCSSDSSIVCPAEDILPAGSYQTFGGLMTLTSTTTGTQFECDPVGFVAKTKEERGTPLHAAGEYLLMTAQCGVVGSSPNCSSVSMASTQNSLHMSNGGGWTIGHAEQPLTVTLVCWGVKCQYSATSAVEMSVPYGAIPGEEATITNAPMKRTIGGFLCPGGTSFELDYEGWLQTPSYLTFDA